MKPQKPVARKNDYKIEPCDNTTASRVVKQHHYSKSASHRAWSFCAYRDGEVKAVVQFLPPLPPVGKYIAKQAAQRGKSVDPKRVLALTRMVVVPGEPQNVASMLAAHALRDTKKRGRWQAVVTFADTSAGHTGQVYRALNAEYLGLTDPTPYWTDAQGRRVSQKSTKTRTKKQMIELGLTQQISQGKHRFVWWL